jgi:hypothetical protein
VRVAEYIAPPLPLTGDMSTVKRPVGGMTVTIKVCGDKLTGLSVALGSVA